MDSHWPEPPRLLWPLPRTPGPPQAAATEGLTSGTFGVFEDPIPAPGFF